MGKKILIVDDNPGMLKIMNRFLEREGHEVLTAADGLSALDILKNHIPDVIFCDFLMPNIGGEKLCRIIRTMPQLRDVYLVVFSALAAEGEIDFAEFGANACMAKGPFDKMSRHVASILDRLDKGAGHHLAGKIVGLEDVYQRAITKELLCSKKHLEAILDNMSEGILELTPEAVIVYTNPAAVSLIGMPEEKLLGLDFTQLFSEVDGQAVKGLLAGLDDVPQRIPGDSPVVLNGRQSSVAMIPVKEKGHRSIMVILNDVTECMQAREVLKRAHHELERRFEERTEELRESERKYRQFVRCAPAGICELDLINGRIVHVNDIFSDYTGYSREDLLNMNFVDLLTEESRYRFAVNIEKSTDEEEAPATTEYTMKGKDGKELWVMTNTRATIDKGQPVKLSVVLNDITELKIVKQKEEALEAQLRQAQKMEAIGSLAGGIAHDFNNVLFPIIGYAELIMDDVPEGSKARKNLNGILKAANRAKDLVQQILAFSRQVEKERRPVQIQSIIKEAGKLLRSSIPKNIEIRQEIEKDCRPVMADPVQIHQVIMNLCTNAYHAMREKGGVLKVTLMEEEIGGDDLKADLGLFPGTYLKLTVSDTGHGMDKTVMSRIFDPYFTTKAPDEGTGMGLSVVHGIVKGHGGEIEVQSEPDKGTVFHVHLPIIDIQDFEPEVRYQEPIRGGSERILVVDDEELIIQMLEQILEDLGYHVTPRTSSVEALKAFEAQPDRFDLVITDMTMPNMTGAELAPRLLKIRPDIPIIICTGFNEMIDEKRAKAMGIRAYVGKPVVIHEIARTIRKVLDKEM
ncbi:MAG: response regulator [Deltaproteobacteria bacterium]|nr:response regulator [Deltaproteobacteria bacterium]